VSNDTAAPWAAKDSMHTAKMSSAAAMRNDIVVPELKQQHASKMKVSTGYCVMFP
jgi:hypothetical protein